MSGDRIFTSNFILLWFGGFSAFGSFHILLATLPGFVIAIGGNEAQTGLIIGIFAAASMLIRPFVGQAVDLRGKRIIMLAAALTIFMATAFYSVANTIISMLAVRVLHGLGWGAFSTAAFALLADMAPERRRGEAIGYYGVASNLATGLWPVIGVLLQKAYGFPFHFYSTALVGLSCLLVTLPISEPAPNPKTNPNAKLGSLRHLFERSALLPSVVIGLLFFSYASIVSFMPLLAHERGFENPGLYFTVFAIVAVLGRIIAGRLADRYGRSPLVVLGMAAAASSLVLLAFSYSLTSFLGSGFLMAVAFGIVQPALMALTIDRVKPEARGIAMGTYTTATDLGVSIGSFVWGFVAQLSGFTTMFLVAGITALAGVVVLPLATRVGRRRGDSSLRLG